MGIVNFGDINRAIAASAFNYSLISAASGVSVSLLVKEGEGFLHSIFVTGNTGILSFWDSSTVASLVNPIGRSNVTGVANGVTATLLLDVGFINGLVCTLDATGTGSATRNHTISYV